MFKKLFLSASFLLASHVAFSQGVAINEDNSSAATSAILDIKSTTKGLLAPRMTETEKNAITSPATGLLIYQTNATAGFYYYNGSAWTFINAAGQNGLNSLSRTTVEALGGNCATGGIKVEYGLDINSNGTLDTGEENALLTKFVCNGATGANGTNGLNSLARTTAESAGGNCANGGIKVEYGLDTNNNAILDAGEINAIFTRYVCNGATGATGSTGATGTTGQGVPTGGTAGQVLSKINGTDYNTQWVTPASGGTVSIANGGTGATTATDARTNLGLQPLATMTTVGVRYYMFVQGVYPNGGCGDGVCIGVIFMASPNDASYSGNSALPCNGQLLNIASYNALFSIIGTTYGGNGSTTFALPNLNGANIMPKGQ